MKTFKKVVFFATILLSILSLSAHATKTRILKERDAVVLSYTPVQGLQANTVFYFDTGIVCEGIGTMGLSCLTL